VGALAIRDEVCNDFYAGTREGVILVSKAPPKSARKTTKTGGRKKQAERPRANGNRDGVPRRAELADFLRNRREALQPEEVGLPGGGRRRTPGLRREEVAALAGVGTTWYTWLEQGRDVRASVPVLEAVAGALDLTAAERAHLILLGRGEQIDPERSPKEELDPTLKRMVETLGPSPASIIGRRWDFLAWNDAYAAVFGEPQSTGGRRNAIWSIFMDPARRELHSDWEEGARRIVARFRADSARYVGDPDFEALISALQEGSPEFREWWDLHEIATPGVGKKVLNHPIAGKMKFWHAVFRFEEASDQRLILYTPCREPGSKTPEKLEKLLAGHS
jgi:transcriptional regulator with XRE-family HTH domain